MRMNYIKRGAGKPIVLIHGIGGSLRSWQTIIDDLALTREVIAVDLPGHGESSPLQGATTIATLSDAITKFLAENDLTGVDVVGSSMGARLVLELARRGGIVGGVVSLIPGGFWQGWQVPYFYYTVNLSVKLVRALQPVMPQLTKNPISRSLLFAQFSARPWRIAPDVALDEMRSFAASPVFDELLHNLAYGEVQKAAPRGSIRKPLVIGWGRQDRVCLPGQSRLALDKFPDAKLHWFEHCGHFPQLDKPQETVSLILNATKQNEIAAPNETNESATETPTSDYRFQQ
ncbi:MAG: alpha/beta fold hydrolase [Pyrinomonadaceae bacterium]|nr:alpha/beta fold hydrolase [Pyrinomonadaceae bacterium]